MLRLARVLALALGGLVSCFGWHAVARAESARISMSASSNRVAVGEPFGVEIRVETHGDDPESVELPDFGDLQVLGRSTSQPFSFSFGFGQRARVKSETIYGFTLRATERGAYAIRPAIMTIKGRRVASQALNLLVVDPSLSAQQNAEPAPQKPGDNAPPSVAAGEPVEGAKVDPTMFLRTVVDKKRVYLGQQVTVTIYLYLRGQLGDTPSITREPTLDGFWSNDLLPMQRSLSSARQEIQGRVYNAYVLRRFAAFPLRTGTLEVGAPAVEVGGGGSIFDLLNGPSRPVRRDGVKVAVEVLPLPAQPTRNAPTHTGTLALEATLDTATAKVGEAVTLRVVAKGMGNLRGLTLRGPRLSGVDALEPEIDDRVENQLDVIGGERTFRWLILPRQPGTLKIPRFVVDVFDPETKTFASVRTAPLTLTVSGAASASDGAPRPASDDSNAEVRFGPLRAQSELLRRTPELRERGWFWPSVLAAPLLLLGLWLGRSVQRRVVRRRAAGRDDQALREVEEKLGTAQRATQSGDANGALSALQSALKKTLEARLGEPVGGLTWRALGHHLTRHALEPRLIERVIGQLGAIERARFDPGSVGTVELTQALDGVRGVVRELGKVRNKRAA
jgi:hypothetical protein